jgi:hypothetical protein
MRSVTPGKAADRPDLRSRHEVGRRVSGEPGALGAISSRQPTSTVAYAE